MDSLIQQIVADIPNFIFAAIGMYFMLHINIKQRETINRLIDIIDEKCTDQ